MFKLCEQNSLFLSFFLSLSLSFSILRSFTLYRQISVRERKKMFGKGRDGTGLLTCARSHLAKIRISASCFWQSTPHFRTLVRRVAGTRKKKQPADGFC